MYLYVSRQGIIHGKNAFAIKEKSKVDIYVWQALK